MLDQTQNQNRTKINVDLSINFALFSLSVLFGLFDLGRLILIDLRLIVFYSSLDEHFIVRWSFGFVCLHLVSIWLDLNPRCDPHSSNYTILAGSHLVHLPLLNERLIVS